jgi:hypothetical protein
LLVTTEFEVFDISVRAHDKAHATTVPRGKELIAIMFLIVSGMPIFDMDNVFK